ncbi:hypothetical membrane protein [Pseudomonas veronii 1YdBTEX2]|uniref:Hypothetical membrane protein n=1 Tax=Pseudomonas veronii 1YdBTEX2 TaxID=1295141 RepID=A0A1D3K914_PSEVE|nr:MULTISPECIES: hypothetical protein [Pseudomonas]SBW84807.1 hypothetical membrane protein [Pseudomonas veronii 1YdBTEX2]
MQNAKSKRSTVLAVLALFVAVGAVSYSVVVSQRQATELAEYCAKPVVEPFKTKLACIAR